MIDSAGVYPENDGISLVDMSSSSNITVGTGGGRALPPPGAGGGDGGGGGGGGDGDLGGDLVGVGGLGNRSGGAFTPGYVCRTV